MSQEQTDKVKSLVDAIFMMRNYWSQVTQEIRVALWQQVLDREDDVDNAEFDENTFSPGRYDALNALQAALEPFRNDWDWENDETQNNLWGPVSQAADDVNAAFEFGGNSRMSTESALEIS